MYRTSSSKRRPNSSAPGEVSGTGIDALSNARRAARRLNVPVYSSRAAYFPTQASLFRDSYGLPVGCALGSIGRHYPSSNGRLHANANGGSRNVISRHHDVERSPSTRRPPPPSRRAATAGAYAGPSPAADGSGAADAIAFQYYSQQHQSRGRVGAASSPHESESTATPVRRQPFTVSGGNLSAPATPSGGTAAALSTPLPSRSSCRLTARGRGGDAHFRLHRHSSASPSPTEHESVIRDTSTSLVPVTPSAEEGRWPDQLTPSQHQQCEGLVRLLAQLPAAQAHRVLLATIRQYEAQRLLQFYGGVHALPETDIAPRAMPRSPSTSSLTSSSGKVLSGRRQDDGRSALFEALRAHLHDMQRADLAAQALSPFTAAANHRQRGARTRADGLANEESHVNHSMAAHSPTPPSSKAARRPQPARRQTPQDSARKLRAAENGQSSGIGDARAPRHLRSRVLASRVAKPCIRSTKQGDAGGGNGAALCDPSAATRNNSTPPPPHNFMQTIKPPHRHGLAGALMLRSCAAGVAVPVACAHDAREHATTPLGARQAAVAGLGKAAGEADLHRPVSTAERGALSSSPPALGLATIAGEAAPDTGGDWPLAAGTTLSPGAAAARRAYWERQQKEQEQQRPPFPSRLCRSEDGGQGEEREPDLVRCSHTAHGQGEEACDYPRRAPSRRFGGISGEPGRAAPGSVPFEDSARRREAPPLAYVPYVTPGAAGAALRDATVPSGTPGSLLGIPNVRPLPPPPPQNPEGLLSLRVPTAMATPMERANFPQAVTQNSVGEPAAFITDFTGAPASALSAPTARSHDHKGDKGAGTTAGLPSNRGAFGSEVCHVATEMSISSNLYEKRRCEEGSSGIALSAPPFQSTRAKELDAQHLLSSQVEFEDDVVTASSIRSEWLPPEQGKNTNYDGATAWTVDLGGAVGSSSREVNESSDEVKLPWEL
ncbi:hypothetical protein CUR178_04609 [Leishmania enriettii]|uniref:Uncharacterized protein n=1 Tax=Leishmania enriettii TaxID=5663 RepID=A0A836H4W0_LEIEN|nr:hypothetical protein CUR178_04609 [Leishmania enriettii]